MEAGMLCFASCLGQHKHTKRVQSGAGPKWGVEWKFPVANVGAAAPAEPHHEDGLMQHMSGFLTLHLREEIILDRDLFQPRAKGGKGRAQPLPPALHDSRESAARAIDDDEGRKANQQEQEQDPLTLNPSNSNPSKSNPDIKYVLVGAVSVPLPLVFSTMSKQKISSGPDKGQVPPLLASFLSSNIPFFQYSSLPSSQHSSLPSFQHSFLPFNSPSFLSIFLPSFQYSPFLSIFLPSFQHALSFKCPPTWFSLHSARSGDGGGAVSHEERQVLAGISLLTSYFVLEYSY
jgi:hypothetical protein